MNTLFYGRFVVKFLLNLIFKNFPKNFLKSSFGIKVTCNAPEISTLQKIKNSKPPRTKYQKQKWSMGVLSVQHCNFL